MTNIEARKFLNTYRSKTHNFDREHSTSVESVKKRAINDSNKAHVKILKGKLLLT